MKRFSIRLFAFLLTALLTLSCILSSSAEGVELISANEATSDLGVAEGSLELPCKSAILMEANTGAVLYLQNADEAMAPASVTKIMTLLLIMEAVDNGLLHLDDTVTVSANAASMGGSQVYLKEGEQMILEDLLKSVVIASANDAAVALAEYHSGSVDAFVKKMNAKAELLGMKNTSFENVTGLDDTAEHHVTSARDIALMSRELLRHPTVLQYSSLWMDSIRGGEFGLTNTNRLVRFYRGCTGLKTGSTSKAGFCVSATAERDGMSLICVIMGAESRDVRNAAATTLLDWGFAGYGLYTLPEETMDPVRVTGGKQDTCAVMHKSCSLVLSKDAIARIKTEFSLPESVSAPVRVGDEVGSVRLLDVNECIATVPVTATEAVEKIEFFDVLWRMLAKFLMI